MAETLQHSLLPDRLPEVPGVAVAARYLAGGPDVEIGGDWYDFTILPDGRIAVALGDVVGRGERAAALMGQLRNASRAYALDGRPPGDLIARLNALLIDGGSDQMATLVCGLLDQDKGTLVVSNAGHPPPLIVSADGAGRFLELPPASPVGAVRGEQFREVTLQLEPGETVVMYTDGLIEDRHRSIDVGLGQLLAAAADAPTEIDAFCGHLAAQMRAGRQSEDDTAILAFRLVPLDANVHFELASEMSVLAPPRCVAPLARRGRAAEDESYEILVVCGEACTNAIRHAGGPVASGFVVDGCLDDGVTIRVQDHGTWRTRRPSAGGRGITIMRSFVDDLDLETGSEGTVVTMRRRLGGQPAAVAR